MERAISRNDLISPRSSPEVEFDPEDKRLASTTEEFDYVAPADIPVGQKIYGEDGDEEDGLEFRLFATSTTVTGPGKEDATTKIKLRSPSPQTTEPGFLNPQRPSTYYFADDSKQEEYIASALSGAGIVSLSRKPWPGSAFDWRVLHLPPSGQGRSTRKQLVNLSFDRLTSGETLSRKRTRPGKKARIKLRIRLAATRRKTESEKADAEAKELAEKMKKAKRNREKKFKKRARDKAKKMNSETPTVAD